MKPYETLVGSLSIPFGFLVDPSFCPFCQIHLLSCAHVVSFQRVLAHVGMPRAALRKSVADACMVWLLFAERVAWGLHRKIGRWNPRSRPLVSRDFGMSSGYGVQGLRGFSSGLRLGDVRVPGWAEGFQSSLGLSCGVSSRP